MSIVPVTEKELRTVLEIPFKKIGNVTIVGFFPRKICGDDLLQTERGRFKVYLWRNRVIRRRIP